MDRLLLIDDDIELCDLIAEYLCNEGFSIDIANNANTGISKALSEDFDLIILDVMLPDLNGYDVLKQIQKEKNTPVIMLTAKGDEVDLVVGLEMGADDYVPKPCRPRELVARIKANIRRSKNKTPPEKNNHSTDITLGEITLDQDNRIFYFNGDEISLTSAEYSILSTLFSNHGETVSKENLSELAMGRKLTPYDRSIDVHISSIRKKLDSINARKLSVKSIRGVGYIVIAKQ
ncbi:MAG: DNA-binding response regulator [Gammaproteobacteria bacterium]|nr:MAG: DNA-binding response regulator [Gammaproteobacteria bacterium]